MIRDCLPIWQVRDDDLEEARSLRARGASVTNPNEEGELPLVLACMNANLEMARWLRSEGADVSATDEPLSATDEPLSATDEPLSATDEPLSATDEPLSAADEPLSATDEPLSAADEPLSAADEPLSAADEPLRWLRTEGADVSATDAEGNCPAHAASMCSPRRSLFPTGERHRCRRQLPRTCCMHGGFVAVVRVAQGGRRAL
jgi:ankyrin repeat protein